MYVYSTTSMTTEKIEHKYLSTFTMTIQEDKWINFHSNETEQYKGKGQNRPAKRENVGQKIMTTKKDQNWKLGLKKKKTQN